ncbi:putative RNA exonuclease Rex3 [Aspergillus ruber CBS 135680]|uniref:RNA exonuclease 3 n=1 Tax=Aspergillus ruber (strain CBS 135680) TaxID=1388766 RepID=A0A017SC71_ASPRC|nr:putative RNA exonuclease Rex3 [Aspergillus ruber CBS 135680]EYE94234.1 putative RNA exonuclease Rex3 [Aspergillus ruber CBS 135680]
MFPPLGLFKDIPCPQAQNCSLLVCLFSHKDTKSFLDKENSAQLASAKDAAPTSTPVPKRRKIEPTATAEDKVRKNASPAPARESQNSTDKPAKLTLQDPAELQSTSRKVSPPHSRAVSTPGKNAAPTKATTPSQLPPRKARKESLNPRMLTKAPASHGVRLSILTKLHSAMSKLNAKLAEDQKSENKYLILSPSELVTMALDEEEKAAKDNPGVYGNVIKLRIVKLSKISKEDWANEVKAHLNARYYKFEPVQEPSKPKDLTTKLSAREEIAIVEKLITPLEGLEEFGYVTRAPSKEEIENAKKGIEGSQGWEQCARCGGRFQVWPGRRPDGSLTSGGQCTHHPGKPMYPPKSQTEHITGPREAYYSCCNESLGASSGCTKGDTHVFKVSETKRLASMLQFEKTPWQPDMKPRPPVCFDCEMGYTTFGMELIRLTAVSWPDGKPLLDILVRPMGEVLDLNSRFSGVFPEHYANAVPYDPSTPTPSNETLQVVDCPAAARSLLFTHLQPTTPIIGHAIDNDLNACRIIHPTVIDTVILYPAPRGGLPNRMSLKTLCRKFLEREIQTGGERGHDSKEDAVSTGDLVRVKVGETWKVLKAKGWNINVAGGKLVPPEGTGIGEDEEVRERALEVAAGVKRKGLS